MDASMCTSLLGAAPVAVVSLLGLLAFMQSSRGTQGAAAAPERQQYSLGLQHIPLQDAAPFLLFALLLALECLMRVGVHRQVGSPTDTFPSSVHLSGLCIRARCRRASTMLTHVAQNSVCPTRQVGLLHHPPRVMRTSWDTFF